MTPPGKRTGSKPARSPRKKTARTTRKRKTAPTHSWSALAFWLGMAVVLAVGAGIYTRHFLAARPTSLHGEARRVATDLRTHPTTAASRPPRTGASSEESPAPQQPPEPPSPGPTPSVPESLDSPEPTPRRRIAAMEEEMYSALRDDLPTYDQLPRDFEGHEPPPAPERPTSAYEGPPRVALIVDDGGYGGEPTEEILALDPVLTLAILPFAPHSRETAEAAAARGFELMLHMPMESADPSATYPGGLTVSMTPEEVREATREALADVPGIAGANNHTGSRYTEDEAAISAFLSALDPNALYFVDSRTSPKSRAYETAARLGFPALSRDVFLDNRDDRQAILRQTDELIERAQAHGAAIGICHFRPVTASVLGEVLDRLEAAGIEVVPVSQLMASAAVQSARRKDSAQ